MRHHDVSVSPRLGDLSPREKARLRWSVAIFALGTGTLVCAYLFTMLAVDYAFARYRPPLTSLYAGIGVYVVYAGLACSLGGALLWWSYIVVGRSVTAVDGGFVAVISPFVSVLIACVILFALTPFTASRPIPEGDDPGGYVYIVSFIPALVFNPVGWGALLVLATWGALFGAWLRRSLDKERDAAAESSE